jgi:hypothetical protein
MRTHASASNEFRCLICITRVRMMACVLGAGRVEARMIDEASGSCLTSSGGAYTYTFLRAAEPAQLCTLWNITASAAAASGL